MPEVKKPYVEITPAEAKEFFETPDAVVEAKRDALFGEQALGRFAVNAISKRGLVGVVFAPDAKGVNHPARVVNLGKDFGTPVHADFNQPFESQYESLDAAAREEEQAENMAAETMTIKQEDIDALDTPDEIDQGEPTQTVDMKSILDEGREAEISAPSEREEVASEDEETPVDEQDLTKEEPVMETEGRAEREAPLVEVAETAKPETPRRDLSVAERLGGVLEAEATEEEPDVSPEQQKEIEKLELHDMEITEAVSKVVEHVTEQLDAMSKATVEVVSRFDETYPNTYRIGQTIDQSGVLLALEDMKKTFGDHDARISDMQTETARYVEAEESAPKQEQTEERAAKQALRQEALETIKTLSERVGDMEEANSGVLEIQRNLDSALRDYAQVPYYPDVPVFRGATDTTNTMVAQLTGMLVSRSESAKRVRSLIEDLTDMQGKLRAE